MSFIKAAVSIITCFMVFFNSFAASFAQEYTEEKIHKIAEGIIEWKTQQEGLSRDECLLDDGLYKRAGSFSTDWYAIALGILYPERKYPGYLGALEKKIAQDYDGGFEGNIILTDYHRIAMAFSSLGKDPENIGGSLNINLIADFVYNADNLDSMINSLAWGLMAMDFAGSEIPPDSIHTRDDIIKGIMKLQKGDGGFALTGNRSDPDVTAMAVQALAPYRDSDKEYTYIRKADDMQREKKPGRIIDEAMKLLSEKQLEAGDYKSWGTRNSQSVSQVIIALCSLGKDPFAETDFIKNKNTLVDGLMVYRREDKGFANSIDSDRSDSKASEQALLALTALLRQMRGEGALYEYDSRPDEKTVQAPVEETPDGGNGVLAIVIVPAAVFLAITVTAAYVFIKRR